MAKPSCLALERHCAAQVHSALDSGPEFLVSPGSPPSLVTEMAASGLLTLAGAITPTEVMIAQAAGADVIKLFPSDLGGISHMRALFGPFAHLDVIPTGGVTASNVHDWLRAGALAVGVGGELVPNSAIEERAWGEITLRARAFREASS